MKVVLQKPDLDTCLTALLLGVSAEDDIVLSQDDAPEADLADPCVLCIEAGGSGRFEMNNFDHHDPTRYFPPACRQAMAVSGGEDRKMVRLVDYICLVDEASASLPSIPFPSLSNLFSGMLLVEQEPVRQFFAGLDILRSVLDLHLDPFAAMPRRPPWERYVKAKLGNTERLRLLVALASFHVSRSGLRVGLLAVPAADAKVIGGTGALYGVGCQVAILFHPTFGMPPVRKFTIAGNGVQVASLISPLGELESGWGGRQSIIGSPRHGSDLSIEAVLGTVIQHL